MVRHQQNLSRIAKRLFHDCLRLTVLDLRVAGWSLLPVAKWILRLYRKYFPGRRENVGEMVPKVLVIGAGGFVGRHVVRLLRETEGVETVPATRDGAAGSRHLDLLSPETVEAALSGIDAVVHCAVGDRRVTVDGTRNLLSAAAGAGVRRIVVLSSVAVYAGGSGPLREDSQRVPVGTGSYAGWKLAAEDLCLGERRVESVLLRPTIIYGPGSVLWVDKMVARIRSGHWGTFGAAGDGTCNLVHVRDVATAVAAALMAPGIAHRAFNLDGPEAMSWNDWFRRLAEGIGAPPLPELFPAQIRARSLLSLPFKAVDRLRPGLVPQWALAAPAGSELALFGRRTTYPIDAAREALGWTPRIGVAEGLRDTLASLSPRAAAA